MQKGKAAKRRERLEAQEAAREADIAQEVAAIGVTDSAAEAAQLDSLLRPMGLRVVDIPVRETTLSCTSAARV